MSKKMLEESVYFESEKIDEMVSLIYDYTGFFIKKIDAVMLIDYFLYNKFNLKSNCFSFLKEILNFTFDSKNNTILEKSTSDIINIFETEFFNRLYNTVNSKISISKKILIHFFELIYSTRYLDTGSNEVGDGEKILSFLGFKKINKIRRDPINGDLMYGSKIIEVKSCKGRMNQKSKHGKRNLDIFKSYYIDNKIEEKMKDKNLKIRKNYCENIFSLFQYNFKINGDIDDMILILNKTQDFTKGYTFEYLKTFIIENKDKFKNDEWKFIDIFGTLQIIEDQNHSKYDVLLLERLDKNNNFFIKSIINFNFESIFVNVNKLFKILYNFRDSSLQTYCEIELII